MSGKFNARIEVDGREYDCGTHPTEDVAAQTAQRWAELTGGTAIKPTSADGASRQDGTPAES